MLKRGNFCFPTTTKTSRSKTIDHFTIACLVAWPLNESEASLSFKGKATKHTTVKWSIPHKNTRIQKLKKEKQKQEMRYPRGPQANKKRLLFIYRVGSFSLKSSFGGQS